MRAAAASLVACALLALLCVAGGPRGARATASHAFAPVLSAAHNESLFWGTYRPNVYFGTRTRSTNGLLTGLMWYDADADADGLAHVRHTCEEGDRLAKYGWLKHDGRAYGKQEIHDNRVVLTTEWVKVVGGEHGGEWAVRVRGRKAKGVGGAAPNVGLLYYAIAEGSGQFHFPASAKKKGMSFPRVDGSTLDLGKFSLVMIDDPDNKSPEADGGGGGGGGGKRRKGKGAAAKLPDHSRTHFLGAEVPSSVAWKVKDEVVRQLRASRSDVRAALKKQRAKAAKKAKGKKKGKKGKGKKGKNAPDDTSSAANAPLPHVMPALSDLFDKGSNVAVLQRVFTVPFSVDIVFVSHSAHHALASGPTLSSAVVREEATHLSGPALSMLLEDREAAFDERFERTFALEHKGHLLASVRTAKAALSNMLGGVGYFYGDSYVKYGNDAPHTLPSRALFSAVPSRSFFPRGFLWDEGFHQLLIGAWDRELSKDVLMHWLDMMDDGGWIPREQILGGEARSKVPEQFQVQHDLHANPPTLLFPVLRMLEEAMGRRVNPHGGPAHTVESGDADADANRAFLQRVFPALVRQYKWFLRTQEGPLPHSFRWRGRTPDHTLASGLDDYPRAEHPSGQEMHVDLLSWMAFAARMLGDLAEYLGEDASEFRAQAETFVAHVDKYHWNDEVRAYLDYNGKLPAHAVAEGQHMDEWSKHVGYVSLFPLLMGVVHPESEYLKATLDHIQAKDGLWTPFGLRSLAANDPLFGTKENYWRGPLWININYLVVSALHRYYIHHAGPYQEQARQVYAQLRTNVINNLHREYKRTGYLWEQYNPNDGRGQRSHPFTGWTATGLVLMMAEQY